MGESIYDMIDRYIKTAFRLISSKNEDEAKEYFKQMTSGMNMQPNWEYNLMFTYRKDIKDIYLDELPSIIEALNSYKIRRYEEEKEKNSLGKTTPQVMVTVEQNNNQSVEINFTCKQVIDWVKDNSSIGDYDKNDIIQHIAELESISAGTDSKIEKWAKLKSFLNWLGTKGVDIAIQMIPLILQAIK